MCVYVHACMCVHVCMHVCVHACVCVHSLSVSCVFNHTSASKTTYIWSEWWWRGHWHRYNYVYGSILYYHNDCEYVCVSFHACVCACMCVCVYVCVHIHVCIYVCVCVYSLSVFVSAPKCRDIVPGSTDRPTDPPTDRPWMKLKVHKCACVYVKRHHIRHAQHPQLIHTLPGVRAGH